MLNWEDYLQAIAAVFVITDPIGRPVFFAMLTQGMNRAERRKAVFTVITAVVVILGGAALVGKMLLDAIGIDLGAFSLVGGLIVASMGFEMMAMGEPSRVQGGRSSHETPDPEDQLIVPFAMPFIAGPGAITIVITLAARTKGMDSTIMALVAVGVVATIMMFTFTYLTDYFSKLSARTMGIVTRFGGLIISTIGVQLMLNGIKVFFSLGT